MATIVSGGAGGGGPLTPATGFGGPPPPPPPPPPIHPPSLLRPSPMEVDLPAAMGKRHALKPEEELRIEVPFGKQSICKIVLHKGSCELWGVELAIGKIYTFDGGFKCALFTWHGCVVDVDCEHLEISYTSEETNANVAYVNTHAQLEAIRDEAVAANSAAANNGETATTASSSTAPQQGMEGPRVLVVGPPESGKTSLTKVLIAYATKLGRSPLWVDLDPAENALSVPGTLSVVPATSQALTVENYASGGIPPGGGTAPLVLFHGSTTLQPDLFKAQVTALSRRIDQRMQSDPNTRSSGMIVNTNGWIQDEGYQMLLHTIQIMWISIVLIMGHDRLYSMMSNHYNNNNNSTDQSGSPKIIKLPRSGGTVSREAAFLRQSRSRSMKRYFYGDMVDHHPSNTNNAANSGSATTPSSVTAGGGTGASATTPTSNSGAGTAAPTSTRVPQLTPFLLQIPFAKVTLYKFSAIALSASLLPVGANQSTEAIQVQQVEISEKLQHAILAVCHPNAVEAFQASQRPEDLYESGVAGFVAVERVMTDSDTLHLLCPCAGSLPSDTLIVGEITWME